MLEKKSEPFFYVLPVMVSWKYVHW